MAERQVSPDMDLYNETAVNVATLLQGPVGETRSYQLQLERFPLDSDLIASDVSGTLQLTRLPDEVLANVRATANVELTCLRCLETYVQPAVVKFQEEFRVAFDVRTGRLLTEITTDERFEINDAHELDIAEPLRQELIVSLPMRPDCGEKCPGPPVLDSVALADESDNRFAALAALLDGTNER